MLVSTTWESNNDDFSSFDNFLYGVGFDLAIPYFQYANVNFYRANNENTADDYQMTIAYAVPFKVSSEDFLVDGFLDWSTAEKDHASELNWTTQYKWNVGKHISPETRLYLGIEGNNCKIRHRIRRGFRRSCNFSKKIENHFKAFDLTFFYINNGFI